MNTALYDDEGNFVGFCYTHQGRKVIVEGEDGCQHETCVAYRQRAGGKTMFNVQRLKQQNAINQTDREIEKEITETAKREGRELQRPTF